VELAVKQISGGLKGIPPLETTFNTIFFSLQSKIPMSSSQSSQFPPKSIVKNKSYEGVEALRQIASTSLFLDNEQKANGQTIPTIQEPDEGRNLPLEV
jgi:hypothetical protein